MIKCPECGFTEFFDVDVSQKVRLYQNVVTGNSVIIEPYDMCECCRCGYMSEYSEFAIEEEED